MVGPLTEQGMSTVSVRLSPLVKDYIEYRKELGENTSLDSSLREILDETNDDWREKAREYREQRDE